MTATSEYGEPASASAPTTPPARWDQFAPPSVQLSRTANGFGGAGLQPLASFAVVTAMLALGLAEGFFASAVARLFAVVTPPTSSWAFGAFGHLAVAIGALGAHRYGGRFRPDRTLLTVASVLLCGGGALAILPSISVPQLVHPWVILVGSVASYGGLGLTGGVAIRRCTAHIALPIASWVAGNAVAQLLTPLPFGDVGAPVLGLFAVGIGTFAVAVATVALWTSHRPVVPVMTALLAMSGAVILTVNTSFTPSRVADPGRIPVAKSLFASVADIADPEIHVSTTWAPTGRVDVTRTTTGAQWIYVDGAVYGLISPQGRIRPDGAILPLTLPGPKERVLIIGAGGGQEVRAAVEIGATSITVAEPHVAIIQTLGNSYRATGARSPFDAPTVRIVPEEARAFLRANSDTYDLILVTLAAIGGGADPARPIGSVLHTQESIAEYLRHLSPDGMLAIRVHDDHELWRTFNTAFRSLADIGSPNPTDAIRHLLAVNDTTAGNEADEITLPLVVVRRTAFPEDMAQGLLRFILNSPFPPIFIPYQEARSVLSIFATANGPATAEANSPVDIAPARDDHPYFGNPDLGLPWQWIAFLCTFVGTLFGAVWASRRPSTDFADFDDEATDAGDVRPASDDLLPWRAMILVAVGGASLAVTSTTLIWGAATVVGRPDLVSGFGFGALGTGALIGTIIVHRASRNHVRAVVGWGALTATLYPIALLEGLRLSDQLLVGQPLDLRIALLATLYLPVGIGLGTILPATLRILHASNRTGWEALIWGVMIGGYWVGPVLTQVCARIAGDTATTLVGATGSFAVFLLIGLRWFGAPVTGVAADVRA